ncbi:MAG: sulfatase-like hydrolase/transferase [bacterium]|nr:sulfatase-like hydrolase/transferase [bacterium]
MHTIIKIFCFFITITLTLNSCTSSPKNQAFLKNVVFIIVDTLSRDYLGVSGNSNSPSPNIDKLTRTGVVFKKAYSPTEPISSIGIFPSLLDFNSSDIPIFLDYKNKFQINNDSEKTKIERTPEEVDQLKSLGYL